MWDKDDVKLSKSYLKLGDSPSQYISQLQPFINHIEYQLQVEVDGYLIEADFYKISDEFISKYIHNYYVLWHPRIVGNYFHRSSSPFGADFPN